MAIKFESKQLDVLNFKKKTNLLVSASAGTGKTSVLTEKVARLIFDDKVNPKEILVVTFTRAAAAEMLSRIRSKLKDAGASPEILLSVEEANFQTFDSFYLYILKKYGPSYFGINKNISIMDSNVYYAFLKKEISSEITARLSDPTGNVSLLFSSYKLNQKNWNGILDFLFALDKIADNYPNKSEFYLNFKKEYFEKGSYFNLLDDYAKMVNSYLNIEIKRLNEVFDLLNVPEEIQTQILERVKPYLKAQTYEEYTEITFTPFHSNMSWRDFGKTEETKEAKKIVESFYKEIKDKIKLIFDPPSVSADYFYKQNYELVSVLFDVIQKVEERFFAYRLSNALLTFNDVSRMVLQLLKGIESHDGLKEFIDVKRMFKYIFIDEFQDTSLIQDEIVRQFSNDNLLIVGDVKQSIYKFRNAKVEIFQNYQERYSDRVGGEAITLDTNFRSRKEIIRDINKMFIPLFDITFPPLNYALLHQMKAGNTKLLENSDISYNYGFEYLTDPHDKIFFNSKEKFTRRPNDGELVVADIIRRLKRKELVFNGKQMVPLQLKDIAVLVRRKSEFDEYVKLFNAANIPIKPKFEIEIVETDSYYVFVNIIKALLIWDKDKPMVARRELTSIVRSFLVEENDKAIYEFNVHGNISEKIQKTIYLLNELQQCVKSSSLPYLVLEIFRVFDFYNKIASVGDIGVNQQIMETFYNFALQSSKLKITLADFLELIKNFEDPDNPLKFDIFTETENAVLLSSIHASKGLQYKVVYYPDLKGMIRLRNQGSSNICFSTKYGLISLADAKRDTNPIVHMYKSLERSEELAERIRLLYVALTRAEEKAIIVRGFDPTVRLTPLAKISSFRDLISLSFESDKEISQPFPISVDIKKYVKLPSDFVSRPVPVVIEDSKIKNKQIQNLVVKGFDKLNQKTFTSEELVRALASFESNSIEYGIRLHAYFESLDFTNPNTSLIPEPDKTIIGKVLELPIFMKIRHALNVFQEFEYYDEEQGASFVIDLLVEFDDCFEIIDYKTSDITKEIYVDQLNNYRRYIQKNTTKRIDMYLVSILKKEVTKVREED